MNDIVVKVNQEIFKIEVSDSESRIIKINEGPVGPPGPPGPAGPLGNSLVGNDGITVISGSSFDVIEGFRSEFLAASGFLSTEIDSDISLHTANPDAHHVRYTDAEAIATTEPFRVTLSGHLQSQIDSIEVDEIEPAIIGSDGITVTSGTDTTIIQGFRGEFLAASGSLSSEIDINIASHAADTSAHHLRYTDSEAISATEPARNTLSGTLSSEIDSDISFHALNTSAHHVRYLDAEAILATETSRFTLSGTLSAEIDSDIATHTGDASAHHTRYTDAEAVAALQPTTDSLQNQINAIEVDEIENALVGSDGITIVSGTSFDTIQGFRGEFLAASGFLSAEIDSDIAIHTADSSAHHSRYTDQEAINATEASRVTLSGHLQSEIDSIIVDEIENSLVGTDGITVISGSSLDTIQGFRPEFLAASGFVQNQVDSNFSDIINLQASGVALSSDIASLQQEDLTFVKVDGSIPITGDQEISRLGVGNAVFPGQQLTVHGAGETQVSRFRTANPGYNSWIQLESIDGLELISFIKGSQQKWTIRDNAASNLLIANDQNIPIFTISNGGTSEALRVNASSFVGIGNINPVTPLQVKGKIRIQGAATGDGLQLTQPLTGRTDLDFLNNAGASRWRWTHDGGDNLLLADSGGNNVIGVLQGAGTGGEVIRIDAQGEVGIGTTTPTAKLHVNGTTQLDGFTLLNAALEMGGPNPFIAPRLTSAQRDTLTPGAGWTIFNTDRKGIEVYDGSDWTILDGTIIQDIVIESPTTSGMSIPFMTNSRIAWDIQNTHAMTSSGSLTYSIEIDSVGVTGISGVTANTTTQNTTRTATANNSVAIGDKVTLVINSFQPGVENFSITVAGSRT